MSVRHFNLLLALLCLGSLSIVHAGGPLSICNDGARTPIKYSGAGNVVLNYDLGALGTRTKAQADALVESSVAIWTNAPAASITISRGADLPVDVTTANYATYNVSNDGLFPVIYDTDGTIIDLVFGANARNSTTGFAGSSFFLSPNCRYAEGRAVISGFLNRSDNSVSVTIAHEIGHLIGMDHSQLDDTQGLTTGNRPLMYPINSRGTVTLSDDDEAAISALYPDGANIGSLYGELTGNFVLADGITAVRGANIWATNTTTGRVYSIVSDYRMQNTGHFRLLLPPGTYNLRAEAIQTNFTGGSSVGPYSEVSTDPSFQAPLYVAGVPMAILTLGNGSPTAINISAGCLGTVTFRFDGTGAVGGNCSAPTSYPLTVSKNGTGTGTVTASSGAINCGATCVGLYATGSMITLTATPTGGSVFGGWSGACSGVGSCAVTVNNLTAVTANFLPPAAAAEVFPPSCQFPSGWTTPAGSTAGWSVSQERTLSGICSLKSNLLSGDAPAPGAANALKARTSVTANFGAGALSFSYNVGSEAGYDCLRLVIDGVERSEMGACNGAGGNGGFGASGNTNTWVNVGPINLPAGVHTITWSYEKDDQVTTQPDAAWIDNVVLPPLAPVVLTAAKAGAGSGTVTATGINCGADCTESVTPGTMVTLSATAATGSTFTGWSGGGCAGTATCQVTVNADTTVTATFALNQYLLTVTKNGGGAGTVSSSPVGINCGADCSETLNHGTMVTLTATPNMGSAFAGWSGGGCAMANPCVVSLTAATTVTATFNIAAVVPGAPTLSNATAGNTQATLIFAPPVSDGGSPITGYSGQCQDVGAVGPIFSNLGLSSPIVVTGLTNGVVYNCVVRAINSVGTGAASNQLSVTPSVSPALGLTGATSRKTHGGTPRELTIVLGVPVTGAVTVEPRNASSHLVVFKFNNTVLNPGSASLTNLSCTPAMPPSATTSLGVALNEVLVTLSGVPDNCRLRIALTNVNGSTNAELAMGFLVGDVSNSHRVSAADIAAVKSRSGPVTSDALAPFDVSVSGTIGPAAISQTKSRSGLVLQ